MQNRTLTTLTNPFWDGVPTQQIFCTNFCSTFAMVDDFIDKPLLLRNSQQRLRPIWNKFAPWIGKTNTHTELRRIVILHAETIESCKNMTRFEGSGIHVRGRLCPEDGCAPHWNRPSTAWYILSYGSNFRLPSGTYGSCIQGSDCIHLLLWCIQIHQNPLRSSESPLLLPRDDGDYSP